MSEEYIGKTRDTLRHRVTVHRQQIRDVSTRMSVAILLAVQKEKQKQEKFKMLHLYKMQTENTAWRKIKEIIAISLFQPTWNKNV